MAAASGLQQEEGPAAVWQLTRGTTTERLHMSTAYFYGDRAQSAARILLATPALRDLIVTEDSWWAGAEALKVETPPYPLSDGQRALFAVLEGISSDRLALHDITARVDGVSLAAVHSALSAWWGVEVAA